MALIDVNWHSDERQLRQFAVISLAGFGILGSVAAWKTGAWFGEGSCTVPLVLWIAALAIGVSGLICPRAVWPVYVVLMMAALPIGWVITHALLLVLYFGVFTPIALVFRLIGFDPLRRRFEPDRNSYWIARPPHPAPKRYFRQPLLQDEAAKQSPSDARKEFEEEAQSERVGLVAEFIDFLAHNKKWWLLPIIVILLLTALLVFVGGTGAAPFVYTLF